MLRCQAVIDGELDVARGIEHRKQGFDEVGRLGSVCPTAAVDQNNGWKRAGAIGDMGIQFEADSIGLGELDIFKNFVGLGGKKRKAG